MSTDLLVPSLQTEIYRKVFRCVPDDLVTSWTHYRENASHAEKFNKPPAEGTVLHGMKQAIPIHGGPGTHGAGGGGTSGGVVGQGQGTDDDSQPLMGDSGGPELDRSKSTKSRASLGGAGDEGPPSFSGPTEGWSEWEQAKMEELLNEVRGHLGKPAATPSLCQHLTCR
jgi:phospholipase D1/2